MEARANNYHTKIQFDEYVGDLDSLDLEQRKTLAKFLIYGGPKKKSSKNSFNIYGKEINYTDRLIFTFDNSTGETSLIQKTLLNHDYKNLDLLNFNDEEMKTHIVSIRNKKSTRKISKTELIDELLAYFDEKEDYTYVKEDFEQEKTDLEISQAELKEILEKKHIGFNNKDFELDPEQVEISQCFIKGKLPLVVHGVAGGGKTFSGKSTLEKTNAYQILTVTSQYDGKAELDTPSSTPTLIYLTQNAELRNKIKSEYEQSMDPTDSLSTCPQFDSYESFLEKYDPSIKNKVRVGENEFLKWLSTYKQSLELKNKSKNSSSSKNNKNKVHSNTSNPMLSLMNKLGNRLYEEIGICIACNHRDEDAINAGDKTIKPGHTYARLGVLQSLTEQGEERKIIQQLAKEYVDSLKGAIDLNFYHPQLPQLDIKLVIDEFQDLTLAQKQVLLKACKGQACIFNDNNQNLNSAKSSAIIFTDFSPFQFYKIYLKNNYRCSKKITRGANVILETKFLNGKNDVDEITHVESPEDKEEGILETIRQDTDTFIKNNKINKLDPNVAIICFTEEDKARFLNEKFANVFMIHEIKGLEFSTVYVIQPFDLRWEDTINQLPDDAEAKVIIKTNLTKVADNDKDASMKHEVYTAFTRAQSHLYIVQTTPKKAFKKMLDRIEKQSKGPSDSLKVEVKENKTVAPNTLTISSIEEWKKKFNVYIEKNMMDQAKQTIDLFKAQVMTDELLKEKVDEAIAMFEAQLTEKSEHKEKKIKKNKKVNATTNQKQISNFAIKSTSITIPMPNSNDLPLERIKLGVKLATWQSKKPPFEEICQLFNTTPPGMWEQLPIKNEGLRFGETLQNLIIPHYLNDIWSVLTSKKPLEWSYGTIRFLTVKLFEYIFAEKQDSLPDVEKFRKYMSLFINEGWFDVNQKNSQGKTPLFFSAEVDSFLETTKALVNKGADVNVCAQNESPLLIACGNKYGLQSAYFLYEKGAIVDDNLTNDHGESFLHYACAKHGIKLVKMIKEKGANINLKTKEGVTPLIGAMLNNNLEIIKYLIENGADLKPESSHGYTALLLAIQAGDTNAVKLLVKHKAPTHAVSNGFTPLIFAFTLGDIKVISFLETNGPKIVDHENKRIEVPISFIQQHVSKNYKELFLREACLRISQLNCIILYSFLYEAKGKDRSEMMMTMVLKEARQRDPHIAPIELACMLEDNAILTILLKFKNRNTLSTEFVQDVATILHDIRAECGFTGNDDKLLVEVRQFILSIYDEIQYKTCDVKGICDLMQTKLASLIDTISKTQQGQLMFSQSSNVKLLSLLEKSKEKMVILDKYLPKGTLSINNKNELSD